MNFRRLFTAMALLALCVGLANAQVALGTLGTTSAGALSCQAAVAAPPLVRAEGITELLGDIVLTCTGGPTLAAGQPIPTANFTVSLGTNVTSRLLNSNGQSEALLLIDEPGNPQQGTVVAGAGPSAPQTACTSAPCQEFVAAGSATVGGQSIAIASGSATAATPAANVFQGIVSGNQVTFNGIPVLAPSTTGVARVFRITNVRAYIPGLGAGSALPGVAPVLASIAISGNTALPVNNPVQTVGFIQKGLSTAVQSTTDNTKSVSTTPFQQCTTQTKTPVATLQFAENFATAFKTRGTTAQTTPGFSYFTESGLVNTSFTSSNSVTGATIDAGLADSGTRLKAVFNNLPAGVRLFVTTSDVNMASTPTAGTSAVLVVSENAADNGGVPPATTPTTTVAGPTGGPAVPVAELPIVGGSATAVWEVVAANSAAIDKLNFGVYISYTANPGAGTPAAGTPATVNMSFAPTSTVVTASTSAPIPRFVDTSSAANLFSISICQTVLLYPFVTNQGGFDTGIAIANTTTDPFGTAPQAGTCTLNFYGASAPSAAVTTANIPSGTVFTTLASTSAAGFQGYMIAVCNFQLAHGFAFISDLGARNLAMGYLAEILPGGTASRPTGNELLGLLF